MEQTSVPVRVAVIGASGIGKHHAKWWAFEGADVCAFAGSSPESVQRTLTVLKDLFGFSGRGYSDVGEMLAHEKPDIVDVCSPNPLHFSHVEAALDAGCHVLCEKPFVYDPDLPATLLKSQARRLVETAFQRGRRLAVCLQHTRAAQWAADAFRRQAPDTPIARFCAHLASPARGRGPDPLPLWIDLGPHVLSAMQTLFPNASIDATRIEPDFSDYRASMRMYLRSAPQDVEVELSVWRTFGEPTHARSITINDFEYAFEGGKDEQGVYCSVMKTPGGDERHPDMMRLLIRDMLHGRTPTGGAFALRNQDLLLDLAALAVGNT